MASYKIVVEARAEKELRKLAPPAQQRIVSAIDGLSENPHPSASRKMIGSDCIRLRAGDYRVIYKVEGHLLTIFVIAIGHRREVYR